MEKNIIIAIDGYSSCGKSTLAKALARELQFVHIDTGAMYRAVTLYFLRFHVKLNEPAEVAKALKEVRLKFFKVDDKLHLSLNGEDVSKEIRHMTVSAHVSAVSAIRAVRIEMVEQQRHISNFQNIVMDGRDIGTVVFPEAQLKIFMTASPEVRAERRYQELLIQDQAVTLDEVLENIMQRDAFDAARSESPLKPAEDAIILDNTALNESEQLQFVLEKAKPLVRRSLGSLSGN